MSFDRVLFKDATAAIARINILLRDRSAARNALFRLVELLLDPTHRFTLYLGAGCSKQVFADVPAGEPKYLGRDWEGLLQALLEQLPDCEQREFFDSLGQRVGAGSPYRQIRDLFAHFDKLNVAWYLGSRFSRSERDEKIKAIVEPSGRAKRSSPLLDELKQLRFRDIVTTNYDSNIQYFFDPEKNILAEITNAKGLYGALDGKEQPGLFYLHGKAGVSDLILDRFDYAQLLAEPDGILAYVTFLLRNSHVIYVGFGLDDPTFNLIETRLNSSPDAKKRPESFALLQNATEGERTVWRSRQLHVVDYGDHDILAELFECVNRICAFVGYAEPNRPPDAQAQLDRTGTYMQQAADNYVAGEFGKSILGYRAALGSTILWERDETGDYRKRDRAELVCDILIRLAQSHYKLRWNLRAEKGSEDHSKRMEGNLRDAKAILDRMNARSAPHADESALRALETSINVLNARIKYHDGDYPEARNAYLRIIDLTKRYASDLDLNSRKIDMWRLKIAEAYYYSQCQISRIDYQVRPGRCDWRKEQIGVLREVGRNVREICLTIAESNQRFSTEAEHRNCLSNFGTILRIAQWTEGRLMISILGDLLPTCKERSLKEYTELSAGLRLLQADPWADLCQSVPPLEDKRDWRAPVRWLAMKYRYEARGNALRWVVGEGSDPPPDCGSLLAAYACIQEAMEQTRGRDLERQQMLNVLEAARLSVLIMFGERVKRNRHEGETGLTGFSCAVALHHLNEAFEMMESLKTPSKDQWHRILAYRIASYFGLLVMPIPDEHIKKVSNQSLCVFLRLSAKEMKDKVTDLYSGFARTFQQETLLGERIANYRQTFELIQSEIQGTSFATGA